MTEYTRRGALTALGAAAVAATAGCSASAFVERKEKTETGTIDPGDATELTVRNRLGGITVETAERERVRYRARMRSSIREKNFDELVVRGRHEDGTLAVEAVHEEDGTVTERDPELDLTLTVPESLSVTRVVGATSDVTVTDTRGNLTVEATTADIEVRDVDGDVSIRAETGDATVEGATGFVGGRLDTGDLEVRDVGGLDDTEARTGDLDVEIPAIRDDTEVSVETGDLTAALGADLDAAVVATADTGDVEVEGLELAVDSEAPRATGTLGEGTHELRFEADTGDIDLEPLS